MTKSRCPTARDLRAKLNQRSAVLNDLVARRGLNLIKGSRAIAEFIGCSQAEVLKLVHQGSLPAWILGNALVARPESLRQWAEDRELEALLKRTGLWREPKK